MLNMNTPLEEQVEVAMEKEKSGMISGALGNRGRGCFGEREFGFFFCFFETDSGVCWIMVQDETTVFLAGQVKLLL